MPPPPPPDAILETLQSILQAWKDENYKTVVEKCLILLKRKKLLKDFRLTTPLQRVLLQAYVKLEHWDAMIEWAAKDDNGATSATQDLVLYAQYRKQDYANVVRLAKNDTNEVLLEHLTVQSQFHLHRSNEVLETYQAMVDSETENEIKMEMLTNAMSAIVSMVGTPTVSLKNNSNETISSLTEQASALLEENDTQDGYADLATNLGILQFLTDPSFLEENWLEVAEDLTEDNNDLALHTALQWSQHFWYKDMEDIQYSKTAASAANLSVPQSIANFNRALLEENLQKIPLKPHPKWNSLQIKMYWYNRAILQLKAKQLVECQESCQSLRKTLGSRGGAVGGIGKKQKKKGENNNGTEAKQSTTSNNPADLWWESRVDVLMAHALSAQSKQIDAISMLTERLESLENCTSSFAIDHAITHVALHRYMIEKGTAKKADYQKGLLKVLKDLPKSIRALPGAYYTLGDLEAMVEDSAHSTNGKSNKAPKSTREEADVLFEQGSYEEACKLYKDALPSQPSSDDAVADSQLKYVQALAMTGQSEASRLLWEALESSMEQSSTSMSLPDGSALEEKALPRSSTGGGRSSLNRNLIANEADDDKDDKPSRDKILRYRARKREAFLKQLEAKGQYNPDRPVQPNPERWLPKYERSRARNRGRAGTNRSAQGGFSEKDAQQLDAAAKKAGKVPSSSGPSTANMKVSSGNRRGGRKR
jgi:tetratricopeptide (TPR) repeat protein